MNATFNYTESSAYSGVFNMAMDACLAKRMPVLDRPWLRFYRWLSPTVSVGRSVPLDTALGARLMYPGSAVCKRPTGGGVVYHGNQLSFSLVWPRLFSRFRTLRQSYCDIHLAVQIALSEFGIASEQARETDAKGGIVCSNAIVQGDLIAEAGTKLLGGAQWRSSEAVLYQGHLWLKWMPPLEEAIAFALERTLEYTACKAALQDSDIEIANKSSAEWCLQIPQ